MDSIQVFHLAHAAPPMAEAIRAVMFQAYLVEAALLGVQDFVPLRRTAAHVASTDALFLGISLAGTLAAVAEVESPEPQHVHIGSLVVLPSHFRRGLGTALVRHCQRSPKFPPPRSPKSPPLLSCCLSCLTPRRRACGTCGRRRCLAPSKELWETPLLAFSIAPAGSIGHSFLFWGVQGAVGACSGGAGPSGAVNGSLRVSSPALRFSLSR